MKNWKKVGLAAALAAFGLTTGCIHVSQRALENGRAMTSTYQYRNVMYGNRDMKNLRELYYSTGNARLSRYSAPPFTPFGRW